MPLFFCCRAVAENGTLLVTGGTRSARSALTFKDDHTAFNLSFSSVEISAEDITSFNYKEETGKLTVKFTTVFPVNTTTPVQT